jgi:hypothetical protein
VALIDEVIAKVEALVADGSGALVLTPAVFTDDLVGGFFTSVVQDAGLTIRRAQRTPGQETVAISGEADLFGYTGLDIVLTFASSDAGVASTIEGTLTANVGLPLITWVSIANAGVSCTLTPPDIVSFGLHADIVLSGEGGGTIPITVAQTGSPLWQLAIGGDAKHPVTVAQLADLLSGNAVDAFLPSALVDELRDLQLSDLAAQVDVDAGTVDQFSLALTVSNGWSGVIPRFGLAPGLELVLSITDALDASARQTSAVVRGTLNAGTTPIPVFVQGTISANTPTDWLIGLDPETDGVTLPSISDLFALIDPDAAAALPNGLEHVPAITVSALLLECTLEPAAVNTLTFAASTTSPWNVVDGFLTIEKFDVELDVLAVVDGQRPIGGFVAGTVGVGDTWLQLRVTKDPSASEWTMTGGIPTGHVLDLTDLVAKLLSPFVTIPASAPKITFQTVDVTVDPGKNVAIKAASNSPWQLVDDLAIDTFALTVGYTYGKPSGSFTGSLDTNLKIAGVDVAISAALTKDAAWTFAGQTAPGETLDIGALIADLGSKLHVDVPQPVRSLKLENLHVAFTGGAQGGSPQAFSFGCEGTMTIGAVDLDAVVAIALTRNAANGYDKDVSGTLTITTRSGVTVALDAHFSDTDTDTSFTVDWTSAPGQELTVDDVAHAFGFSGIPELPPSLQNVGLAALHFTYKTDEGVLAMELTVSAGGNAKFGNAVFVSRTISSGTRAYALGLTIHLGVTLAEIPLVGGEVADAEDLGIDDAGVWILSSALAEGDAKAINAAIATGYPTLPDRDIASTVMLHALLKLGAGNSTPLDLALYTPEPAKARALPDAAAARGATAGGDGTHWFSVQKQIGAFSFERIGIGYQDDTLRFALDAGIDLGPLTFSLQNLSVASPLTHFSPSFDLGGLGLNYDKPPLEIAGALLKLPKAQLGPDTSFQFDGAVVITTTKLSISGIGSYAQLTSGDPSLFVFAQLTDPLGGPPPFFITGLMAGFGFNRSLAIPAQDEVANFPLLLLGAEPQPGTSPSAQDPMNVLQILEGQIGIGNAAPRAWIVPEPGSYWLAAGLSFTSFKLVESRALLIGEMAPSGDLTFALLGISQMTLPMPSESTTTYAYVEMMIRVVLQPTDGIFQATAILSANSYVLTESCHLTGGFAFYLWFGSNDHAGEFVVTLGGYHPAFSPPAYYPSVPRLGFNWAVSDDVSVTGDAYFALTPSCGMAGGGLEVNYHDGDLHAWFTAHADVLVSWRPFFFIAEIDVSIGVSYRLNLLVCHKTISVSIGASVTLWGPPTGGRVHIDLTVVSFTVGFGSDGAGQATQPLAWSDVQSMLPHPAAVCTISAGAALASSATDANSTSGKRWVVRPRGFTFSTQSAVPSSALQYADPSSSVAADPIAIRPMNRAAVHSAHTLTLRRGAVDGPALDPAAVAVVGPNDPAPATDHWTLRAHTASVAQSLWGAPPADFSQTPNPGAINDRTIDGVLTGFDVTSPQPTLGAASGPVQFSLLGEEYPTPPGASPLSPTPATSTTFVPSTSSTTIDAIATIASGAGLDARNAVYEVLQSAGIYAGANDPLTRMQDEARTSFADQPMAEAAA